MTETPNNHDSDRALTALSRDVAHLVRIGGPRPKMGSDSLDQMQETLRPLWKRQVERHSPAQPIGRLVAAAGLVILAIAAALFTRTILRDDANLFGKLARLDGSVTVWTADDSDTAEVIAIGAAIETGRSVATSDSARAALQTVSGHSLRLDRDTRVVLLSEHTIRLEQGAIYIASDPEDTAISALTVLTAIGRVEEIGTQFEVRLSADTLTVRVREGRVSVEADGLEHQSEAGEQLTISAGVVHRSSIDPYDRAFDWTQRIAPTWEIDGHRLSTFLMWVVREGGYTLEYSDALLEREASQVLLRGEVKGLSPGEALEVVLPAVGLTSHIEVGTLSISRPNDSGISAQ